MKDSVSGEIIPISIRKYLNDYNVIGIFGAVGG